MALGAALPQDDGTGVTEDSLLGGRVRLRQPARGYRAGVDAVLLAAAVPARTGERVLDLGCGAGAALFSLAARVGGLELHGLDIDREALALARQNARLNAVEATLHEGDVARPPQALRRLIFDHVMFNPPFFPAETAPSPVGGRDRARREDRTGLAPWVATALARLRPGGWLTVIHRAERLPELLGVLRQGVGALAVLPIAARAGRPAGRIIVQARKGARSPCRLLAPLVLHEGGAHPGDREHYTAVAQAILREAAAIEMREPQ